MGAEEAVRAQAGCREQEARPGALSTPQAQAWPAPCLGCGREELKVLLTGISTQTVHFLRHHNGLFASPSLIPDCPCHIKSILEPE